MSEKQSTVSLVGLPLLIMSVVTIVGIGAVFGLIGYLFSGLEGLNKTTNKSVIERTKDNYFGNNSIQIKTPQKNIAIKNPILISGKANVFEGNVRIRIKDDNKNILADDFITVFGSIDKLHSFEKEINYTDPTSLNGTIEVFEENMKDGSEINKVEIPIVFDDYN